MSHGRVVARGAVSSVGDHAYQFQSFWIRVRFGQVWLYVEKGVEGDVCLDLPLGQESFHMYYGDGWILRDRHCFGGGSRVVTVRTPESALCCQ